MNTTRPWWRDALCAGIEVETLDFFDVVRSRSRAALDVCSSCPVRQPCLEEALECERPFGRKDVHGVRGGLRPYSRSRTALGKR